MNFCEISVPPVWHAKLSFNFLKPIHVSRCQIPECGEHGKLQNFDPEWLKNAVPATASGFASCERYAPVGFNTNGTSKSCPDFLFNQSETIPCDGFVYAKDSTVVFEVRICFISCYTSTI